MLALRLWRRCSHYDLDPVCYGQLVRQSNLHLGGQLLSLPLFRHIPRATPKGAGSREIVKRIALVSARRLDPAIRHVI